MQRLMIIAGSLIGVGILLISRHQPLKNAASPARVELAITEVIETRVDGDSALEARLLEIARGYEAYGRVDDWARWAPELCRTPEPSHPRFSRVGASSAHGGKLYFLFARMREAYLLGSNQPQPAGQVIVKESWIPKEAAPGEAPQEVWNFRGSGAHYLPYVRRDGHLYRASDKSGLFIMMKTGGPETDAGWVYGTVSAGGKVTSSGRVASCMSCHQDAKTDRIFGLRASEP